MIYSKISRFWPLLKKNFFFFQVKLWVQDYNQDLSELEKDVQNVKDILDSLPDGCFKNIDIETPTAQ